MRTFVRVLALWLGDLWRLGRVLLGADPARLPGGGGGKNSPRVAVVLGAQVVRGGKPSRTLLARTLHAAAMYREGRVERVIVTGGLGEHPPSEAEVMVGILLGAGVPKEAVEPEGEALNTFESSVFVARMLRPPEPVYIVTDPLHCVRTVAAFREVGLPSVDEPVYASPSWRVGRLRAEQLAREAAAALWYRGHHGVGR